MITFNFNVGCGTFITNQNIDDNVSISKINLYEDTKLKHIITMDTLNVCNRNPLVLVMINNPKNFLDRVIIDKINKIIIQDNNNEIICFDDFVISDEFKIKSDSISLIHNITYKRPKQVSVFTHVYNENEMIQFWVSYYGKIFGHENLYIIDHSSDNGFEENIDKRVNIVKIPRGEYDNWNIVMFCAYFQRFLSTQYDWVIHTDSDEFLISKNNNNLLDLITNSNKGVNLCPSLAYDIIMDVDNETDLNYSKPISHQRKWMRHNIQFEKTCITSMPTTWGVGFHKCYDYHIKLDELWLMHLKLTNPVVSLKRNKDIWQRLNQSDIDKKFFKLSTDGFYQSKDINDVYLSCKKDNDGSIEIPDWVKEINF